VLGQFNSTTFFGIGSPPPLYVGPNPPCRNPTLPPQSLLLTPYLLNPVPRPEVPYSQGQDSKEPSQEEIESLSKANIIAKKRKQLATEIANLELEAAQRKSGADSCSRGGGGGGVSRNSGVVQVINAILTLISPPILTVWFGCGEGEVDVLRDAACLARERGEEEIDEARKVDDQDGL